MKFTLSWLKHHLDTDASLDDILYALTDLGLEVEEVVNPLDRLSEFTIGYVTHAEKHPDADKLRVCQVVSRSPISVTRFPQMSPSSNIPVNPPAVSLIF